MSYMGLFWETGMPEAWALSRRTGDRPETDLTDDSRWAPDIMARPWSQNMLDGGVHPVIPPYVVPGDNAGRPVPTPGNGKIKD